MVITEWLLVFPLFLFLVLFLAQLGFILNAKQTVTYAAYVSARALLVNGKDRMSGQNVEGVGKKTAALACIGITGLANQNPYSLSTDPDILHIASRYSHDPRSHSDFLQRYTAALDKTEVKYSFLNGFNKKHKVTVEVMHDYEMDFPIVNYFIAGLFSSSSKYGFPHIPIKASVSLD
jgi:hypothetical protein